MDVKNVTVDIRRLGHFTLTNVNRNGIVLRGDTSSTREASKAEKKHEELISSVLLSPSALYMQVVEVNAFTS
jgi:hypothetical protein